MHWACVSVPVGEQRHWICWPATGAQSESSLQSPFSGTLPLPPPLELEQAARTKAMKESGRTVRMRDGRATGLVDATRGLPRG
jgi:hypothetical protein